jgi:tRNA(fMet)-specific endonuclease VapC
MRYMLDTNICIHLIQRHPPALIARLESLAYGDVGISAIVLAELRHGVERNPATRDQAARALSAMRQFFPVLAFDETTATHYGVLRAALPDRRRDALDRLIAAHAVSVGAKLITNNEADFKDYPGLDTENWLTAGDR